MGNFKELGSNVVGGVLSGASGPLGDLVNNRHQFNSLSFPSDVEGVGQRHFVRFNIVTIDGASFNVAGKNNDKADTSATGEILGGFVGAAIGDAAGNGLVGGIGAQVAAAGIEAAGIDTLADNIIKDARKGLGDAISGVAGGVETTFGKISSKAESFKNSVVEKVPIAEDALNGIGTFAGSIGGIAEQFSTATGGTKKSEADIVLFMPFGVSEAYGLNWSTGELGIVGAIAEGGGAAARSALEALQGGGDYGKILEQFNMSNIKGAFAEVGGNIAGQALGNDNIKNKLLKMQGKSVNPYFELFFTGIQPRTFSFEFQLSPKNSTESDAIQEIIRTFKTYAAPPTAVPDQGDVKSVRYWGYPSLFEIEYWNSEKLHKLKPCALTSIGVNYSSEGTNQTFYDGSPIQTTLSLSFTESVLITRDEVLKGY